MIQAAKQGHVEGAYELAKLYLTHTECGGIPFGDSEWEFSDYLLSLANSSNNFSDEVIAKFQLFAKQGITLAAALLETHHLQKDWNLVEYYRNLTQTNWHASIPARLGRAIYWLDQAAQAGMKTAQDLLEKIKTTDEHDVTSLFDYGSRQSSPQSSPESSPPSSPRR